MGFLGIFQDSELVANGIDCLACSDHLAKQVLYAGSYLERLSQCCMKSFEGSASLFNLIEQLSLQTSLLISRETAVHSINIFYP